MNKWKDELAKTTNKGDQRGDLRSVMKGADVFIGVSVGNVVDQEMVRSMADGAVVFAQANPTPEILPDEAVAGGARVVATGRSDFPNQINNVMGFPGVFRGCFDVMATDITTSMQIAAADALAGLVADHELADDYIIPSPLDPRVVPTVAIAVAQAACDAGVARRDLDRGRIIESVTFK